MPSPQVVKLLASAGGKKKQIKTGTKMSMNLDGMRSRSFGVVLNGVIYPIIKPMDTTWSLLKSATTQGNKKFFKAVVEAVTAVKGKKARYDAYQRALAVEFNVPPIVSEFAYEYANRKAIGVNMKEGGDRNLYKNQKITQYFASGVAPLPPAPPKVKEGTDMKPPKPRIQEEVEVPREEVETKQEEEELEVFDVDDKGKATPVVDMERVKKKVFGYRMERLEDEQSASLKKK